MSGFGDSGYPVIELRTFEVYFGLMTMLMISAGRDI